MTLSEFIMASARVTLLREIHAEGMHFLSRELAFAMQAQIRSNWCWAATAASVSHFSIIGERPRIFFRNVLQNNCGLSQNMIRVDDQQGPHMIEKTVVASDFQDKCPDVHNATVGLSLRG